MIIKMIVKKTFYIKKDIALEILKWNVGFSEKYIKTRAITIWRGKNMLFFKNIKTKIKN